VVFSGSGMLIILVYLHDPEVAKDYSPEGKIAQDILSELYN
jgi:hypothetical protein